MLHINITRSFTCEMLATADVETLTTVEDVETGLALVVDAVKLRITALNASRKAQEMRLIQVVK